MGEYIPMMERGLLEGLAKGRQEGIEKGIGLVAQKKKHFLNMLLKNEDILSPKNGQAF